MPEMERQPDDIHNRQTKTPKKLREELFDKRQLLLFLFSLIFLLVSGLLAWILRDKFMGTVVVIACAVLGVFLGFKAVMPGTITIPVGDGGKAVGATALLIVVLQMLLQGIKPDIKSLDAKTLSAGLNGVCLSAPKSSSGTAKQRAIASAIRTICAGVKKTRGVP
jgi:hypothetical protein